MRYHDLIQRIERGSISPLYLFYGNEGLLIDEAVDKITEKFIGDRQSGFNYHILYAKEIKANDILMLSESNSFFSKKQVVTVKDINLLRDKELNKLIPYIKNPSPDTCLIFIGEKIDKRKKVFAAFKEKGIIVRVYPIKPEQAPAWIRSRVAKMGMTISNDAVVYLKEKIGTDLNLLKNETEKLSIYLYNKKKMIESKDVEEILAGKREYSIFELIDNIGRRDKDASLRILYRLIEEGEPPLFILSMIIRRFRQIWMAKEMLLDGISRKVISANLGISHFFLDPLLQQTKKFTIGEIRTLFSLFVETDSDLKKSSISPHFILESLILSIV
ncbi:MAG: DNA polymerase III subunit delta [Nitrospirota bacterium]